MNPTLYSHEGEWLLGRSNLVQHPSPDLPTDGNGNVTACIYCGIGTGEDEAEVEIAFAPARRIIVIKHEDGQILGGYNPDTNAVTLREDEPCAVSLVTVTVTFYSEGRFNMTDVVNATTGATSVAFTESSTTTWTLDSTR